VPAGPVNALKVSGGIIYVGGTELTAVDYYSGQVVASNTGKLVGVMIFDIVTLGTSVFTGCGDSTIRQWDKITLELLKTYTGLNLTILHYFFKIRTYRYRVFDFSYG
jgi:hypothetical protein